jgi:pre-rRNA-processing protein TSR3
MIRVLVHDKCQCDPKKCTAKRMMKFGLAKNAELSSIPKGSVILSPFAEQALSPADKGYAEKASLVVMDLTWTNIDGFPRLKGMNERALPYLIASNPVNWGRPMELNSAEAVLASLMIFGEKEQADELIKRFNWGPEFIRINGEMLSDYADAKDSGDVVRIQNEYLEALRG